MPSVYGSIDLLKNELRNAVVQNLGSAPGSPVKGLVYFNSADNTLYWYDGSQWVAAKGGAGTTLSGTVTTLVVGGAGVAGVGTDASRGDHVHALPGWGAVTAETSFGGASANGSAGTFARSDHTHGNPAHDASAHSAISLSSLAVPTADVSFNGKKITNLADPVSAQDAATKNYVDNLSAGLAWKDAVRVATTGNGALASAFANGQTVDGVVLATGNRILLKNQTATAENGIYTVNASGAPTRATDADLGTEVENMAVFVSEGTANSDTAWVMTTNAPITVGSTGLAFSQFAGGGAVTAGAGLTQSGNTLDVIAGDTTLTVAADSVVVNTAVIATQAYVGTQLTGTTKKYTGALTGTASPETVTHNLGTRDVIVSVVNGSSPYQNVDVDWTATTTNTVVLTYSPNLGAGFRAVVVG